MVGMRCSCGCNTDERKSNFRREVQQTLPPIPAQRRVLGLTVYSRVNVNGPVLEKFCESDA